MRTFAKIVISLLLSVIVTSTFQANAQYTVEKELGSKALGILQFGNPSAVVSDSDGNFYVADQRSVYKMSATGEVILKWSHPSEFIFYLDRDPDGNIIAASPTRIFRLSSNLEPINEFGEYGIEDGRFAGVLELATDADNQIYVLDRIWGEAPSSGTFRIQVFSKDGIFVQKVLTYSAGYYNNGSDYFNNFITKIAVRSNLLAITLYQFGSELPTPQSLVKLYSITGIFQNDIGSLVNDESRINYPNGLTFDSQGNILVSDASKVFKFGIDGSLLSSFNFSPLGQYIYHNISDIALEADGNILLCDNGTEKVIERVDAQGTSIEKFGTGNGEGQFKQPSDVAKDSYGNIYVTDLLNFRIQKFDESGKFLLQFGSRGLEPGQFNFPRRIEIDQQDNIFILDTNSILKFDSNGNFIQQIANNKGQNIQFDYAADFELDIENNVYVLNTNFGDVANVQKFTNDGQFISMFGKTGNESGNFYNVATLAVDNNGDVYVNDISNELGGFRIQHFRNDGSYIGTTPAGISCQDMEVDAFNNLYGRVYNSIFGITSSGINKYIFNASGDMGLMNGGLYVDPSTQKILVTGEGSNNVLVLSCSLPQPSFSIGPEFIGEPTYFADESTNVSPIATYVWDFGDGNISNDRGNVAHVYTAAIDYSASLTIDQGCIAQLSKPVSLMKSIVSDSLAAIDFYNKLNGPNWTNKSNWLTGDLKTWSGLEFENDRLVGIRFEQNNNLAGDLPSSIKMMDNLKRLIIANNSLSGSIPDWIDALTELQEINLSNNQISGSVPTISALQNLNNLNLSGNNLEQLPELSTLPLLQKVAVENNRLTFEDIEPNLSLQEFSYTPQQNITIQPNAEAYEGGNLSLSLAIGGTANLYQWYKDDNAIPGASSLIYSKSNSQNSDAGGYYLQITSSLVPNLTIRTTNIRVSVVEPPDSDGDGSHALLDCNDNDATIYPGAPELCDGKDNNCDGIIDDGCVSPQLWGLTKYGGPGMAGTIFSVYGDGSNSIQLKNSFLASLRNPSGGLLAMPDSSILVTNSNGGINDYGGISRIDKNATASTFFAFGFSNGVNPFAGLVNGNDGWLYGMTALGGNYYFGTIYKIRPDGSEHSILHEFQTDGNGGYPFGSLLIATDGLLYGMTAAGGPNGEGTIFRIKKDGSDYSLLRFFSSETGTYPTGTLIQLLDGELYGTTSGGGEFNFGTVFKMTTDGSSYQVLHHFNNDDGNYPTGFLTLGNDGLLYGQTTSGGLNRFGTIFRIAPENAQFSVIYHFDGVNGQLPNSRLYQKDDGSFIGSTIYGGSDNRGTIFKINPDGTGYSLLHSLSPLEGWGPSGDLVLGKDNYLYGITLIGGTTNSGTVFKINLDGSNFSTIHSYGIQSGTSPVGNLVQLDSETIVGTALEGGNYSSGTIFKINSDGTNYAAIHHFDYPTGVRANGLLTKGSDNFVYGTTSAGGGAYAGTLFKIKGDGSEFSVLHEFDFATENEANGVIEGSDGILYGTTKYGGSSSNGTLFKINKDGSGYSVIHGFEGNLGSSPVGTLVQSRTGALYGMTNGGGAYGNGTVFKINPDGTNFNIVRSLSNLDGAFPNESLTISENGVMYGMTQGGGTAGAGTIFKIGTDDSFSVMYNFDHQNGSQPGGSLTIFKNKLFGYTAYGGQYNSGVVFSYDLNSNQFTKVVDLNDFTGKNPLNGRLLVVNPTNTEAPTTPSGSITFADVSNSSLTISFKPGNGDKRVVLMAEESASLTPVSIMDGTELSGNLNFALATEYQTGWRVVYAGSDSTIAVTGLRGDINYRVTVIEYNGAVTETHYLNDGAPVATQKTLPDVLAPTIAASNITFSAVSYATMQVNFVKGNGEQRLVVMKEGGAPAFTPDNDSFYSGSLENGESVVYNGSGSSINLSDLLPGATYYLKIFEFNTDSTYTRYLIDGAPSASQRTLPDVLAPTVSASSISFSSITPTSMKLNFTVGNGEQRLIIMKSGSQPSFIPADNAFYAGTVSAGETVMYNGSGNSLDLPNLLPGVTYYLKVFEFNTDSTRTRYLTSTAAMGVQQTPQLPAVYLTTPADGSINQNANELKVAANKLDKVKTYTIELSTSSDFGSGVLSKSGVRNQTFSGLSYNTKYFARVKTDLSPFYGKVTSFTTAPPQYFAYVISPADGAKDVSTSVTVSSNPLPEATSYTIELNTSSNFDGISNVKTAASPNILFAGLNKRTTYYARVFTNLSQGLWGKSTSFTTGSLNKLNPAARDSENTEGAELTSDVFAVDILENPFKQRLTVTIKTPVEEEAALKLSDMTGKIIFQSSEKTNRSIEIDKPMVQGVYLIHVRTASGNKIVRVVKVD